jgi:hypothetical protein
MSDPKGSASDPLAFLIRLSGLRQHRADIGRACRIGEYRLPDLISDRSAWRLSSRRLR